ncbi:ABC transporter ATP-binding protein [Nocardiopsis sp. CNT-189]|uniref:ABC transporter ATP-binding protein n=1 Tax=Nocardiopsis oceanisediminis TaxID=2816862 RepID=UPI003B34B9DE
MAQTRPDTGPAAAAPPQDPPVIDVADLTYTYPRAAEPAVRGMDFSVGRGEVFGFLGPSGAGKSTTQKILTGLLTGARGTVRVWGRPPEEQGADYYRRIGVSFELPNHYQKLTALENLEFFASLYGGPAEDPMALLRRVGLGDAARTRVGRFSKGMQTRLTFVRALLHRPELVFLDEPTSGMDPSNARIVKEMIAELPGQGRTVFLTTHSMETAEELCDRVAFVVDGRIAAMDSPEELRLARSRRTVRVAYRGEDGRLESAEFPLDGMADDAALHALLRERRIESVHSQEAGLDDVFVEVTGRSLG